MTPSPIRVRWKAWLRTLHIYGSLLAMVLLLFFATTGFMMNHEDWFELPARELPTTIGQVPPELLSGPDDLAIVELLRAEYGATGALAKFEIDGDELHVAFRKPGRTTEAVIYLEDGYMTVDGETEGIVAAMTQLHKGKRSGLRGTLLVDFVAGVLALTALGGLTLWTTLPRRRTVGYAAIGLGLLAGAGVWWYLVL